MSMPAPEWVTATILIACAVAGVALWLGGQSAKDRINALRERLRLASQQCNDINTRLSDLRTLVAIHEELISELFSNSDPTSERVEELARSNAKIQNALTNLTTSTSHLGNMLIIVRSMRSRRRRFFR